MKITKYQLLQLIQEELEQPQEDESAPEEAAKTSDARLIIQKLPDIDLPNEYLEILTSVINHQVPKKDIIIKKVFGPTIGGAILKKLGTPKV